MATLGNLLSATAVMFTLAAMASAWRAHRPGGRRKAPAGAQADPLA